MQTFIAATSIRFPVNRSFSACRRISNIAQRNVVFRNPIGKFSPGNLLPRLGNHLHIMSQSSDLKEIILGARIELRCYVLGLNYDQSNGHNKVGIH